MSSAVTRQSGPRYRARLNLMAVRGRAYPRVIGSLRELSWLFFDTVLPLLGIAAYVLIYQFFSNQAIVAIDANPLLTPDQRAAALQGALANLNALIGTVVLGGTMIAFWLNVLWSMASQLYWEKEIGNLQLYMMAPMSRMALLGGMAVGGMFMTSTRAAATLIAGIIVFGVVLNLTNPFLLLAVFFVTLVALYGLGMMLASLYLLWGREAWHMSSLLEEPIFFTSGFYFPAGGFAFVGGWGRYVLFAAAAIPATLGLDAMRQLVFPGAWGGTLWITTPELELAILLVLAGVFLVLARTSLGYFERLARREGRLTTRHQ